MQGEPVPPDERLPMPLNPAAEASIRHLETSTRAELLTALRGSTQSRKVPPEALLHFARIGARSDRELELAAIEPLTRLIVKRGRQTARRKNLPARDWDDLAGLVLLTLVEDLHVDSPQLAYGEQLFNSFLSRRIVDALRKYNWKALQATERSVALDDTSDKGVKATKRALGKGLDPLEHAEHYDELRRVLAHLEAILSPEALDGYLEYRLGRTQVEIAKHKGVTDRTVRNWIAAAEQALSDLEE